MNRIREIQWPRIVAEGTVIVIGILLAFWIQAWWDERVEQEEFSAYLIALEHEFVDARQIIEQNIAANSQIDNAANEIFLILSDTSNDELPQSFEELVGSMYTILSPVPAMGAYDDIVSSGNLRLIRNAVLRSRLNKYIHELSVIQIQTQKIRDAYSDIHLSFLSQHFVVSEFGWDAPNPLVHDVTIQVGKATPPSPFKIDPAAIRSKEFWNLAYDWKIGNTDLARRLIEIQKLCDAILELLESEIRAISA